MRTTSMMSLFGILRMTDVILAYRNIEFGNDLNVWHKMPTYHFVPVNLDGEIQFEILQGSRFFMTVSPEWCIRVQKQMEHSEKKYSVFHNAAREEYLARARMD